MGVQRILVQPANVKLTVVSGSIRKDVVGCLLEAVCLVRTVNLTMPFTQNPAVLPTAVLLNKDVQLPAIQGNI